MKKSLCHPSPVKTSPHSPRVADGTWPQGLALVPWVSASTICQRSKRPPPPPITSHASSVCISFCFYGVFWSNLNFQLFIFTKENKIAVARPLLSVSVLLLNQAPIFIASPVVAFCRGLEGRLRKHAGQKNPTQLCLFMIAVM